MWRWELRPRRRKVKSASRTIQHSANYGPAHSNKSTCCTGLNSIPCSYTVPPSTEALREDSSESLTFDMSGSQVPNKAPGICFTIVSVFQPWYAKTSAKVKKVLTECTSKMSLDLNSSLIHRSHKLPPQPPPCLSQASSRTNPNPSAPTQSPNTGSCSGNGTSTTRNTDLAPACLSTRAKTSRTTPSRHRSNASSSSPKKCINT